MTDDAHLAEIYKPKLLTLLTPTGDRPEAFELLKYWVHGMEVGFDYQWIVVDDGKVPTATATSTTTIRRDPQMSGSEKREMSLPLNLLSAVPRIVGDVIVILEDDNFYHHHYVKACLRALANADVVGPKITRYYHIRQKAWFEFEHPTCATLGQTAFRRSFLPEFVDACVWALDNKQKDVDALLWRKTRDAGRSTYRYDDKTESKEGVLSLGIKGMPGRPGLGSGHLVDTPGAPEWKRDPSGQQLQRWLGGNKAKKYGYG